MAKRVPVDISLGTDGFENSVYVLASDDTIWFYDKARTGGWVQIVSPPSTPKLIESRNAVPLSFCVLCIDDVIYGYNSEDQSWEVIPPLP